MDDRYEVAAIARRIVQHEFTRVALQFPDELLVDSVKVASAFKNACGSSVRFFVMADTTYGSCCVDEVAAAHINAECVVHYGHACLSPVASLPVLFCFGRASMELETAAEALINASNQPLLVLFDLQYAHAIPDLKDMVQKERPDLHFTFAEVVAKEMNFPCDTEDVPPVDTDNFEHVIGGLKWNIPQDMEDYKIIWIGKEGPALTSVMLTYSMYTVVRYGPETKTSIEMSTQSRALQRRYYLIEKAKDADMVGIVVGTLGVAGYFEAIEKIKEMVKNAGKRSYTLVVGKPNPAKLANFPECDIFVLVACPQTAFIDSKDYAAPLITPFEAQLAFVRGSQWTGSICLDFRKLNFDSQDDQTQADDEEPRFSFLKGGYVEPAYEVDKKENRDLVVVDKNRELLAINSSIETRNASDFFSKRNFQGLTTHNNDSNESISRAVLGRKGRASVYESET